MVEGKSPQSKDEFSGVGIPWASAAAQAAVEATPEIFGIPEDFVSCSQLGIPDHFSREMLVDQRADGNTRTAIEALECRTDAEALQFLGKFRIYETHFHPFPPSASS